MASRPLSDARLDEIRDGIRRDTDYVRPGLVGLNDEQRLRLPERQQLLAEVERMRERDEQRRLAESASHQAALLALAGAVATLRYIPLTSELGAVTREICPGCAQTFRRDEDGWFTEDSRHGPGCVVELAHTLLAVKEAGETAPQGERGDGA